MHDIGSFSHIGKRDYQQDAMFVPPWGADASCGILAVLCDGMGGLEASERASKEAASLLGEWFYSRKPESINAFFRESIDELDKYTYENALGGTTLVSVVIRDDTMFCASVGDSRIYLIREGVFSLLTIDHNYENELLKEANGDKEMIQYAQSHPLKGALTSYIGMGGLRYLDILPDTPVFKGDIVFLCSDGLYKTLEMNEISSILAEYYYSMQTAAKNLIAGALKKGKQTQDNLSAILIQIS